MSSLDHGQGDLKHVPVSVVTAKPQVIPVRVTPNPNRGLLPWRGAGSLVTTDTFRMV